VSTGDQGGAGYTRLWQSFAGLLPIQSVGVMGDERTYELHRRHPRGGKPRRHDRHWAGCRTNLLASISSRIVNRSAGITASYRHQLEATVDDRMGIGFWG